MVERERVPELVRCKVPVQRAVQQDLRRIRLTGEWATGHVRSDEEQSVEALEHRRRCLVAKDSRVAAVEGGASQLDRRGNRAGHRQPA